MEEGNRGVDKERIPGDVSPDDPISELEKETTGDDIDELQALVEGNFEQNGDQP